MPQQQNSEARGVAVGEMKFEREMSLQELKEYKEHVERVIERMEEEYKELTRIKLPELLLDYEASLKLLIDKLENGLC